MIQSFTVTVDYTILREEDGKYFVTSRKGDKELTIQVDEDAWRMFNDAADANPLSEEIPG